MRAYANKMLDQFHALMPTTSPGSTRYWAEIGFRSVKSGLYHFDPADIGATSLGSGRYHSDIPDPEPVLLNVVCKSARVARYNGFMADPNSMYKKSVKEKRKKRLS